MSIPTSFGASIDAMENVTNVDQSMTGTVSPSVITGTVYPYTRNLSITSDAPVFTVTLPSECLRGQTIVVNWTLSAVGCIVIKDSAGAVVFITPMYTSSATGTVCLTYSGVAWIAPAVGGIVTTLVAAAGNIVANAIVQITGATFAYASTSVQSVYGVAPAAAAAGAACSAVRWDSAKEHVCYSATAAAITAGDKVMVNGAAGGVITATGSGVVVVGTCAATIAATGGLPVRVIPCTPYLSA